MLRFGHCYKQILGEFRWVVSRLNSYVVQAKLQQFSVSSQPSMSYQNQILFISKCLHYMSSAHFIPVLYFILFQWMWKALFSYRASDCINQHTPYLCPLPNGAPAGCCCFLYHLCWHGERQLCGWEHCSPLKTGRACCSLMHTGDKKTNQRGSRGLRQQAEKDDKEISAGAQPFTEPFRALISCWSISVTQQLLNQVLIFLALLTFQPAL